MRELSSRYPAQLLLRRVIKPWLRQVSGPARPDRQITNQSARALLHRLFTQLVTSLMRNQDAFFSLVQK